MTGDKAARSLLLAYCRNESGVGLQLAVELKLRSQLVCKTCSLNHLVYYLVLGRTLCREAKHSNTWVLDASNRTGCLCCTNSNLCKLVGCRNRCYGNVAHNDDAVVAILVLVCKHKHSTANTCHARSTLDNLQSRTQSVACCAQCARDLTIGALCLDNHTAKIERILNKLASLLDSHALLLAKLGKKLCILLGFGVVERIDDSSLVDVVEIPLCGKLLKFVGVADEDEFGNTVGQYAVGCSKCALLSSFGEHNALFVALSARNDVFK